MKRRLALTVWDQPRFWLNPISGVGDPSRPAPDAKGREAAPPPEPEADLEIDEDFLKRVRDA